MTYKEIYEKAANMLDRGEITLGDFNKMVEPLNSEVQPEIVRCEECLYRKICSWEKQGAKFCSFAEKREVTT